MNLRNKKKLIARTLGVGAGRININPSMLAEVKEAITKQDIRDLKNEGIIQIKEIRGVKTKVKRKTKRRGGSIKKRVKVRKESYMNITRKLRSHVKKLRQTGKIDRDAYYAIRKKIKARGFKDLAHFRDHTKEIVK